MDSQDKGEPNIRQRQESLARRVGEALDQLKPNEARDCPDAEIIAAYAGQGLAPDETARWEGHFASCARCRNVLRVLAASSDTPLAEKEVSHLGEMVAAARAPLAMDRQAQGAARPRRSEWRTRWLAPAIGVAAVLVVWFAMRPPWRTTKQSSSQVLVAQAPKEELPSNAAPPAADQTLKEPAAKDQKTGSAPEQERSLAKALPPNSPANAPARKGAADNAGGAVQDNQDKLSASAEGATNAIPEKKELDRTLNGREVPVPAAPAPSAPQAASQAKAKAAPSAAPESLQAEASSNAVASAPAQEKQAGAAQAQTGARRDEESAKEISPPALRPDTRQRQALTAFGVAQTGFSVLKAPASSVWWRAGKGGAIERSNDAGKTWISQMSPSQGDWLAGAALSGTVCWLAGRRGAIARTADGQHWDLIMPPAAAAGAGGAQPDWTGITALDALTATMSSADGRKFATADGGMTWQAQ